MKISQIINSIFFCFHRKLYIIALIILAPLLFISCIDDKIFDEHIDNDKQDKNQGETISFYLNVGNEFSTRYSTQSNAEQNENSVNSIRVFFFDNQGRFLFEAPLESKTLISNPDGEDIYKIIVQVGNLTDDRGNSLGSAIREQLTQSNFKVAFNINWPSPNRPNWNYYHSYLNPVNKGDYPEHLKTLNDLHFNTKADGSYASNFPYLTKSTSYIDENNNTNKNDSASDYRNWVRNRSFEEEYFVTKEGHEKPLDAKDNKFERNEAEGWIRKFWDPEQDYKYTQDPINNKPVYRLYSGLWKLWNFGGSFENNKIGYDKFGVGADSWESEWKSRNADEFAKNRETDNGRDC